MHIGWEQIGTITVAALFIAAAFFIVLFFMVIHMDKYPRWWEYFIMILLVLACGFGAFQVITA